MVYEPREDSWLIMESVKGRIVDTALDMGTGTGVIANELSKSCKKVIAADIDAEAVAYAKKNSKSKNITFIVSDLFEHIEGKFDLMAFNPPYLPPGPTPEAFHTSKVSEWSGGRPLILKFLRAARSKLTPNGSIVLLFSNRTGLELPELQSLGFKLKKLGEQKFFYEHLWVYELFPE